MFTIVFGLLGLPAAASPALLALVLDAEPTTAVVLSVASVALVAGLIVGGALVWRSRVVIRDEWARRLRLARFADRHGLAYYGPGTGPIDLPSAAFEPHLLPIFADQLAIPSDRLIVAGTVYYNAGPLPLVYLGIQLNRRLPHMILLSSKRRRHIPFVIGSGQKLRLEGDFNDTFTLHVPTSYETDALYVFTPDLMALLLDEAPTTEIEVVDDWIFFFTPRPADLADPDVMLRQLRIVDAVTAKAVRQTRWYSDAREGAEDTVAAPGRRLKRGIAVGGVIAALFIVAQLVRLVTVLTGN